jgi:magnesium and cobalt exporter, CNNM family
MTPADTPLLVLLPVLLVASAFFSGTETALFALTQRERSSIQRKGGIIASAVEALLRNPRQLLVTVLLGNMTVNVLYFVVASVLVLRAQTTSAKIILSVGTLLGIILLGEVLPKMAATGRRDVWCRFTASPMLALHKLLLFVSRPLEWLLLEPASRLVRPIGSRHDSLSVQELAHLLDMSKHSGEIDAEEAFLLDAVADLGVLQVRDIMNPRVRMPWLDANTTREQALATWNENLPRIVHICDGTLDQGVIGVLTVKRLLAAPPHTTVAQLQVDPIFVPETATLDGLLQMLRRAQRRAAVVVDEFGAVVGEVTITAVVGRLVQSLGRARSINPQDSPGVETIDDTHWRVSGSLNAHDWMDAFGMEERVHASTVSGLIASALGRIPTVGDTVELGLVELQVESMQGSIVQSAVVKLRSETSS